MNKINLIAITWLFCTNLIISQNIPLIDSLTEAVVITHSKIPRSVKSTSKSIILIDQKDIISSGVNNMSQLLNQQVGIRVNGANSNRSVNQSVFIQGADSEHILFLIDGIPIKDPTTIGTSFDIRNLSLSSVERIEILKGGQSTLYGSEAMAGVINIITKSTSSDGIEISGQFSYSSHETMNQSLSLSGKSDKWKYNLSGGYENSSGISEAKEPDAVSKFDKDGFQKRDIRGDVQYSLNNWLTIKPFIQIGDFESQYDAGAYTDATDRYNSDFVNIGSQIRLKRTKFSSNLSYAYTNTNRLFNTSFGDTPYEGSHHVLEGFSKIIISKKQDVLIGFNYEDYNLVDLNSTPQNPANNIFAAFLNYHLNPIESLNIELGYRYNEHSAYGTNDNYEVSVSYWFNEQLKTYASFSTGFKVPLLPQLYGPFGANPDLLPQESSYYQGGIKYLFRGLQIDVNYFNRKIDDLIVFFTDPVTFGSSYENLSQQKVQGLEVSANIDINKHFIIGADYTYLIGRSYFQDAQGQKSLLSESLLRRPKSQFNLSLFYRPIDVLELSLNSQFIGARDDLFFSFDTFLSEEVILESNNIWDLNTNYQLHEGLKAFISIQNIFNTDFSELAGYNTLGRNISLGMRFNII